MLGLSDDDKRSRIIINDKDKGEILKISIGSEINPALLSTIYIMRG